MADGELRLLLIFDDRELAAGELSGLVGFRRFGDITFKSRTLFEHFETALPEWAKQSLVRLKFDSDLATLRSRIEESDEETSACVVAARSGFPSFDLVTRFVERLPYAEEDFTDRLYKPLVAFWKNVHDLVDHWQEFQSAPLHFWEGSWQQSQRLKSLRPVDLGRVQDFLVFSSGSTAARHFNEVSIEPYYYTKSSSNTEKIHAEYSFYNLVPEKMRPWLVETFDFAIDEKRASYKTIRYYLADAALQWIHGAFQEDTFQPFIERLLFFIEERPKQAETEHHSVASARELFINKLQHRTSAFLATKEGKRINNLASSAMPHIEVSELQNRFLKYFESIGKQYSFEYSVVGHGDPCFSNILYDQQRRLLKLIDPKGAVSEDQLWTHPLYDLCKISHSVLGDYDFINNNLYRVNFATDNSMALTFRHSNHESLKKMFVSHVESLGYDIRLIRLGEASLFLSMLPLHLDHPNKVLAFMLKANQILDEIDLG